MPILPGAPAGGYRGYDLNRLTMHDLPVRPARHETFPDLTRVLQRRGAQPGGRTQDITKVQAGKAQARRSWKPGPAGLEAALILAIGAQNAFVLRQGIRSEHVTIVCLTCALSDAVLIALGVSGFQTVLAHAEWLGPLFLYAGAAFLIVYGARSLFSAFGPAAAPVPADTGAATAGPLPTCVWR